MKRKFTKFVAIVTLVLSGMVFSERNTRADIFGIVDLLNGATSDANQLIMIGNQIEQILQDVSLSTGGNKNSSDHKTWEIFNSGIKKAQQFYDDYVKDAKSTINTMKSVTRALNSAKSFTTQVDGLLRYINSSKNISGKDPITYLSRCTGVMKNYSSRVLAISNSYRSMCKQFKQFSKDMSAYELNKMFNELTDEVIKEIDALDKEANQELLDIYADVQNDISAQANNQMVNTYFN